MTTSSTKPDYIVGFEPANLLSTEMQWTTTKQAPNQGAITWRDQLRDPIYKFVVLVAGMTRKPVSDYIQDDSGRSHDISRQTILMSLKQTLTTLQKKQEKANIYSSLQMMNNYNGKDNWGKTPTPVQSLAHLKELKVHPMQSIWMPRAVREEAKAWIAQQQTELKFIDSDIEIIESRIKAEELKGSKSPAKGLLSSAPGDTLRVDSLMAVCDQHASGCHEVFFSNEMYFKPEFQGAWSMAIEKVKARAHEIETWKDKPLADQLMLHPKLRTCFARLVALNVLIIHTNNTRGEWKGVINYRRLVKQENVTIQRLLTLMGIKQDMHCFPSARLGGMKSVLDMY